MAALISGFPVWMVFLGTLVLGESVVLTASALAAQGSFSVGSVALFAFLGTVVADVVWFRFAGTLSNRADPSRSPRLERQLTRIDRWTGPNPHRALLFIKFVYGTRIASIAYLATRRVRPRLFVSFDAVGTVVWLAVVIPVGWLMGKGLSGLGADLRRFETAILGLVLAALIGKGVSEWRQRRAG